MSHAVKVKEMDSPLGPPVGPSLCGHFDFSAIRLPHGHFNETSSKSRKFCKSTSLMKRILLNTEDFHHRK